jgi:hypothetical protein
LKAFELNIRVGPETLAEEWAGEEPSASVGSMLILVLTLKRRDFLSRWLVASFD